MRFRPKTFCVIWLLVAIGLLIGASTLLRPLNEQTQKYELATDVAAQEEHPAMSLLTVAPGGLRSLLVNYFWIRSQALHQEGRHYDAVQLADIICSLQPRFPSVWGFQAWQMAWNISVETHTPQERWQWVSRGIQLLRDGGIPRNPYALILYKDLGWIFSSKMGDTTDDMHKYYKARWASEMQKLLGAPQHAITVEVLKAFEPIANAPLDKKLPKSKDKPIQASKLKELLADKNVAEYSAVLAEQGVKIDQSLLDAYNAYTNDDAVATTRYIPGRVSNPENPKLAQLINAPEYADARAKMLAFVRAQILWNKYKMDPQFMYGLMKDVGPIDWRLVWAHGLYWSAYGTEMCKDTTSGQINWLNTDRTRLNCLKHLVWYGRMTYVDNPNDPNNPTIYMKSDWRFLEAGHREYIRLGKIAAEARDKDFDRNSFRDGHVNYLLNAVKMLFVGGRYDQAREYIKYCRDVYKKQGPDWDIEDLEEFVAYQLTKDDTPIPRVAMNQLTSSLEMAFLFLADNNEKMFKDRLDYTARVYRIYHTGARKGKRLRLPPISEIGAQVFSGLMARPRMAGYNLPVEDRARLYARVVRRWPEVAVMSYDRFMPFLFQDFLRQKLEGKEKVEKERLQQLQQETMVELQRLLPPPPGLANYRQQLQQRMRATTPMQQ